MRSPSGATRRLRILCTLVVAAFYLLVGFAWLWPQDLPSVDRTRVLLDHAAFMLRTFTFHGGLALLITALFALALKGRRLALAAVPGVIFALYPALPRVLDPSTPAHAGEDTPAPADDAATLTLMSANLLYINTDAADLVAQIDTLRPDVIVFQEYTPHWDRVLNAELSERYPHSIAAPQDDCFGQAVYSRLPFAEQPRLYPPSAAPPPPTDVAATSTHASRPAYSWPVPEIRVVVEFDARPLSLHNIHLLPPATMSQVREQRLQTVALAHLLSREPLAYVVAGDFNFSPASAHHDALTAAGARSAWQSRGSGRGSTWPRTSWLQHLPGIRLDQIFHSPHLECLATGVGEDFGSDHAPVWATLRWQSDE